MSVVLSISFEDTTMDLEPHQPKKRSKTVLDSEECKEQHQPSKSSKAVGWGKGNSMKGLCAPNIAIVPCHREDCRSNEKRFKFYLTVHTAQMVANMSTIIDDVKLFPDSIIVDALVLDNNISVLVMPYQICKELIVSVKFHPDYEVDIAEISGKFKKGSKNVTALDTIAYIVLRDPRNNEERTIGLQAPIAGKMVESNDIISSNPTILSTRHRSDGFLAVFTSDAPSILAKSGAYIDLLPTDLDSNVDNGGNNNNIKKKEKVCFAWIKGTCARGSACKFKHVDKSAAISPSAEETS